MKFKVKMFLFFILMIVFTILTTACGNSNDSKYIVSDDVSTMESEQEQESSLIDFDKEEPYFSSIANDVSSKRSPSNSSDSISGKTVFVGDSVTLKLKYYISKQRKVNSNYFGDVQFLAAGSLGCANALWSVSSNSVHPSYQGTKQLLEDSIQKIGAQKVYIMLGMNDIGLYGVNETAKNMEKLVTRIKAKSPNVKIFIQSVTPMIKSAQLSKLNNDNIELYNKELKRICNNNGYTYIDIASIIKDKDGNLPLKYCSDPKGLGLHFTDKACKAWADYIMSL